MMISTVQTLEVPDVCHGWLENRGAVYELLIDFLGNRPSLSMIAEWSRGSGIGKAAECTKAGKDLMKYLCGRTPGEWVQICEVEGAEYRRLLQRTQERQAVQSHYNKNIRAQDVTDYYASAGVAFNKLYGEADDHIAIQLEFMTLLHDRIMNNMYDEQSMLELIEMQVNFLEVHLLSWVPDLCKDLKSSTDSTLYQTLFSLLEEFLAQDLQMLKTWQHAREAVLV